MILRIGQGVPDDLFIVLCCSYLKQLIFLTQLRHDHLVRVTLPPFLFILFFLTVFLFNLLEHLGCPVFHVPIIFPKVKVGEQVLKFFEHLFIGVGCFVVGLALSKNSLALLDVEVSKFFGLNVCENLVLLKDAQVIGDCDLTSGDCLNDFLPLSCAEKVIVRFVTDFIVFLITRNWKKMVFFVHDLAKNSDALAVDALLAHTCKYVDHAMELKELSYVGVNLTHKSQLGSAFLALAGLGGQGANVGSEPSNL